MAGGCASVFPEIGIAGRWAESTGQCPNLILHMYPNCGPEHLGANLEDARFFRSRREFLNRMGTGFGALALVSLLKNELVPNAQGAALLDPKQPHYAGTASRVCHIYQSGGQAHQDTWDPKPGLAAAAEQPSGGRKLLASPFKFTPQGKSGLEMSEVWPELSKMADELCVIRSMWTAAPAHGPATLIQTCGDFRLPKPSLGAWVVYGLGSANQNLPAYVAMNPGGYPGEGALNWQSAFMPGAYQGTYVDPNKENIDQIIENIRSTVTSSVEQRAQLDLLSKLNEIHKQKRQNDGALDARIQSFELAYRMQTDATEAFDVQREPTYVKEAYGLTSANRVVQAQARQFILARRLLERGVRFVQVWNGGWDTHNDVKNAVARSAGNIDKPIAAFLKDLKERGLLKDTLVASSTEFGRSSTEDGPGGRTHNAQAFSSWLAGGGIKGGMAYGSTDEVGAMSVENKVSVAEFHSTILHALGFDSEKLTFRNSGRDFRLTDVSGARPVKELFT